MTTLQNPYKSLPTDERREVRFDVHKQDFIDLVGRFPQHGSVTAILAMLFKKLVTEIKPQLDCPSSLQEVSSNESRLDTTIHNLNLSI